MSQPPPARGLLEPHEYQALLEVAESITRHSDLAELFHDLAQRLGRFLPFDFLLLLLHEPDADVMRLQFVESRRPGRVHQGPAFTSLESPGGRVWQTQEPMVVADFEREDRFPRMTPVWREFGMRSGCYLPLTTAHRRLGTVCFAHSEPNTYDLTRLPVLPHLARQLAVAVDNTLHFQQAQCYQQKLAAQRDRLELLLGITNAVATHLDLRDLCQAIAAALRRVFRQEYTSLALYDPAGHCWNLRALDFPNGKGLLQGDRAVPFANAPASLAFASRRPIVLGRHELEQLGSDIARALLAEGIQSWCCAPLVAHERMLGTLNAGRQQATPFTPAELDLLGQVANQVALAVDNALAFGQIAELKNKLVEEKSYLEDEIRTEGRFTEVIGTSSAIRAVLRQVAIVAPVDTVVLVQGETGTGKELVARAVHRLSRRSERTFVKLNCAAIPTGLLESELFGHEKGAFTGAVAQKVGRFELADGGTLFLDEVGDIPPELQPKLLRVLQEQEFERLGGTKTLKVNVRLVAATNRDLGKMVATGAFRSDLFYRLNVFPIVLPPLRERREDIPPLVWHFVREHARVLNKPVTTVPDAAMAALTAYPWPGNVRELANFLERAVLLSTGPELNVSAGDLRMPATAAAEAGGAATLAEAEREHIVSVLRQTNWKVGGPDGAAARLGMKRTTLQSRMRKLSIVRSFDER